MLAIGRQAFFISSHLELAPLKTMRRTSTRKKLAAMLTENSGCALCDSGDYYGRHWQRNQGRDFESEPVGTLSAQIWERDGQMQIDLSASLSVYHWLAERLTYNAKLQAKFKRWQKRTGNYGDLEGCTLFVDSLPDARGIYGDGEPVTVNTYNAPDALSQVFQFIYWEDSDGAHVVLQIHGGCDERGGYTDGVCFDVDSELAIFDNARLTIACEHGCLSWDSDDAGYRFDSDNNASGIRLEELEPVSERPDYQLWNERQAMLPGIDRSNSLRGVNTAKLYIDENDKPHCPCCGGRLEVWTL
jgi:hypothetical protein